MNMFLRDTPGRTCIQQEDFFSVAVVSFNRFKRLHHCIDSIHKHADMPFEIVVSDDGGALYDDFNFIKDLKDKISHVAVNLGRNKGLHVNANNAVSLTRSKHVLIINDDIEILKPFMRRCVNLLNHAPYIGSIYLEGSFNAGSPPEHHDAAGMLGCLMPDGYKYGLGFFCGASAPVFRKEYWYEVGGYSEDDIYGDIPFNNKGWLRGYYSGFLSDGPISHDTDKKGPGGSAEDSTGKFIKVGYANYPKLFGMGDAALLSLDTQRGAACSARNHNGRSQDFNEFGREGWSDYMVKAINGGHINWDILGSKYHERFLDQVKRDILPRYIKD